MPDAILQIDRPDQKLGHFIGVALNILIKRLHITIIIYSNTDNILQKSIMLAIHNKFG